MNEPKTLIKSLAEKYGRQREQLLPIMQEVVRINRFLTDEHMTEIARELDISAAHVYGTATFYAFLDTVPRGKYVIRMCKTITCTMHGSQQLRGIIEDMLKVKVGETTPNKKFTLLETNCLGWCHKGPAMLINEKPYTELTPQKLREIIESYIRLDN